MRTIAICVAAGALAAISIASTGVTPVAAHDTSHHASRKSEHLRSYEKRRKARKPQTTRQRTAEDREADFYDPTCQYCGYPSWARIALSPRDFGR